MPLGFLDAQCWVCDPAEFGQSAERQAWPIKDKESYRWLKNYQAVAEMQKRNPHVRLISVRDREGDFCELIETALRDPQGPDLLVRAKNDRQLQDEQGRLFETVMARPVARYMKVQLPRQKDRAPRWAEPIDWRLLSTVTVDSFELACEVVGWYSLRWGIEVFHRILKSG